MHLDLALCIAGGGKKLIYEVLHHLGWEPYRAQIDLDLACGQRNGLHRFQRRYVRLNGFKQLRVVRMPIERIVNALRLFKFLPHVAGQKLVRRYKWVFGGVKERPCHLSWFKTAKVAEDDAL